MFLWHFPSSRPDRTLSCTLPCEARTFLTLSGAAVSRAPQTTIPRAIAGSGDGGGKETRTPDPHAASVMLYQLSYAPATRPYSRRQTRLLRLPRGRARYTVGLVSTRTKWPRAGDVAQLVEHLLCM